MRNLFDFSDTTFSWRNKVGYGKFDADNNFIQDDSELGGLFSLPVEETSEVDEVESDAPAVEAFEDDTEPVVRVVYYNTLSEIPLFHKDFFLPDYVNYSDFYLAVTESFPGLEYLICLEGRFEQFADAFWAEEDFNRIIKEYYENIETEV